MENTHIDKIREFVNEHLTDEFSFSEIAGYVGYSAFHLAREFKAITGVSIMEYTRDQRVFAAAKELETDRGVCEVAMEYCFDTHAGFTKAFITVFGCTPREYQIHARKMKISKKELEIMNKTEIKIRLVCKDDVQDLWENVYSAMTPRQILEDKIMPALEAYKAGTGLLLVAEAGGKVVMSLPLTKPAWLPLGFVWDNNFVLTGGDEDKIMGLLMKEMANQAKCLGIDTLLSPQKKNSESSKAMQFFGFQKVYASDEWEYLMLSV